MSIQQFKTAYQEKVPGIVSAVKGTLDQLLQREVDVQFESAVSVNGPEAVPQAEQGYLLMRFVMGALTQPHSNIIVIPETLALQFYAWMIADEPAEALNDEHSEGIKEALDQVAGQLKMTFAENEAGFEVSDTKMVPLINREALTEIIDAEEVLECKFNLTAENNSYEIYHLIWTNYEEDIMPEIEESAVNVQPAEFGSINPTNDVRTGDSPRNMNILMDVDLEVTVELDRKIVMVSELLKLGKGSIIELEKSAGEPLDIFVNGRKFAEGEVVVIDDKFGIRITQLLSTKERVQSLA